MNSSQPLGLPIIETDDKDSDQLSHLVALAVAQINLATKDSDAAVETLCQVFADVASHVGQLATQKQATADESENHEIEKNGKNECDRMVRKTQEGIVALQFYDILVQRLSSVENWLKQLEQLLANSEQRNDTAAWNVLRESIRKGCVTVEDSALVDRMVSANDTEHADSTAALNQARNSIDNRIDIESLWP